MKIEIEDRGNNTEKVFIPVRIGEDKPMNMFTFFWRILKYSYFFIIKAIILIINFIRYGK